MTALFALDPILAALLAHLWQSTLVAAAAALACLLLRTTSAATRHALLALASLNFLIPFALLLSIGSALPWPPPRIAPAPIGSAEVADAALVTAPAPEETSLTPATGRLTDWRGAAPFGLLLVWIGGGLFVGLRRAAAVRDVVAARRSARPVASGRVAEAFARATGVHGTARVALRLAPSGASPCVAGSLRPVLLWPEGIEAELTDAQLDAVLAHELAHVRRRDNLLAAAQAVVEIVFWFHPLVWWIGARLADERERACDEVVLRAGAAPDEYADGLLKVCESALAATAIGAAGIRGVTLTQRIEAIMTTRTSASPGRFPRALLITAAFGLVAGPVAAGAVTKAPVPIGVGQVPPTSSAAGDITGLVVDQMGGYMAGVTVTARAGAITRTAVTDELGRYRLAGLPAGDYEVRFSRSGFKTHVQLRVAVGESGEVALNAQLEIGAISEEITLRAGAGRDAVDPASVAAEEATLLQQVAQTPDDPQALMAVAGFYYRHERYAESEAAMRRAAALIAARAAQQSDYTLTLPSGGNVKEPRKIRDVKPIYPQIARMARVSGIVILEARVAEDGTVRDVRVLRSVPLLDSAAIGAVRQWLFTPTLLNGVPVEVLMTATVRFNLNDPGLR